MATEEGYQPIFFDPRGLKNLLLVDEMESLCPIMDMQVPLPPSERPVMLAPSSGSRLRAPNSHCRQCAAENWVIDSGTCLPGAHEQLAAGLCSRGCADTVLCCCDRGCEGVARRCRRPTCWQRRSRRSTRCAGAGRDPACASCALGWPSRSWRSGRCRGSPLRCGRCGAARRTSWTPSLSCPSQTPPW